MTRFIESNRVNILVIAHYEPEGKLWFDTLNAILAATAFFDKIYFVSTNLSDEEVDKLPSSVSCVRRENFGYDFYSYREGILLALKMFDFQKDVQSLTLMNSSFLVMDPQRFFRNVTSFFDSAADFCCGATKSFDISEHLQSYLLTFNSTLLANKNFIDWWRNMKPINDKREVIINYEVGLSVFLRELDFKLYAPITGNSTRNPSHEYYVELLELFGIVKFELIKKNPAQVNLHVLISRICKEKHFRKILFKSLNYKSIFLRAAMRVRLSILRGLGKFLLQRVL